MSGPTKAQLTAENQALTAQVDRLEDEAHSYNSLKSQYDELKGLYQKSQDDLQNLAVAYGQEKKRRESFGHKLDAIEHLIKA